MYHRLFCSRICSTSRQSPSSRRSPGCLSDKCAPESIRHTLADLIGQRIFGIGCGHPDCSDAEHLADDPVDKLLLGHH